MKIGLTLPSFVDDPEIPLRIATIAEQAGVDGLFVFEHVFRGNGASRRPALECLALVGAVAAETEAISIGTLVSRATLRPAESLAAGLETARRIAGARFVATIGAGDSQSRSENESYGLEFGTFYERLSALEHAVVSARRRGVTTWVGGSHPRIREFAATADGWNRWGGTPEQFEAECDVLQPIVSADFTYSWGGLVVLDETDGRASDRAESLGAGSHVLVGGPTTMVERLRAYGAAGADWVILGALDATDPRTARLLGEEVVPALG